jgi:hypothetical protein
MIVSARDFRLRRLAQATGGKKPNNRTFTIRITYYGPNDKPVSRYEMRDGACAQMPCNRKKLGSP